jgi:FAD/FMN-containing dehydrogenase
MDPLLTSLQNTVSGSVFTPDQLTDDLLTNFGHIHHWTPRFVVEPKDAADVLAVVRFARKHGIPVSTRGAAHSQSGLAISDGGILVSMRSMSRILSLDTDAGTVDVEAGITWRDLVHRLAPHGLVPPVLTNNLTVTVGGTLSVAGIGVASFRHGTQGDNVAEIDVVTGAGNAVTCSPEKDSELFWATIAGLGQVAILTRARLTLRKAPAMTRTYYLLYDDLRTFLEDADRAMESGAWHHLESWASPCPQGTKPVEGRRQVFAKWFYPFHLTVEYDPKSPPDDRKMLEGLRPYASLYTDDLPTLDFLERLVPVFELWKKGGTWEHVHPWMETVLPWDTAADFIEQVLVDLPPSVQVGGHVLLWPARNGVSNSRLFMRPGGKNVVGFGILPAVPPKFWDRMRPTIENASRLSILMGGKRYLSGYIDFDAAGWREHFGGAWEGFARAKRTFDPDGILNPGFVAFDEKG